MDKLDPKWFDTASKVVNDIMRNNDLELNIEKEIINSFSKELVEIVHIMAYLRHLNALFLNVILNHLNDFKSKEEAEERAYAARRIISNLLQEILKSPPDKSKPHSINPCKEIKIEEKPKNIFVAVICWSWADFKQHVINCNENNAFSRSITWRDSAAEIDIASGAKIIYRHIKCLEDVNGKRFDDWSCVILGESNAHRLDGFHEFIKNLYEIITTVRISVICG